MSWSNSGAPLSVALCERNRIVFKGDKFAIAPMRGTAYGVEQEYYLRASNRNS